MASPEQSITCQVCETTQPNAWYCVTCGMALHTIPSPEWVDPPPEGFEPTHVEDVAIETTPVPGLEPTQHDDVPVAEEAALPGLERAAHEAPSTPSAALPVESVPGLEITSAPLDPSPSPSPQATRCEWCGYPQATGRVCDYCGRVRERVMRTVEVGGTSDEESLVRVCRACGARGAAGQACLACGSPVVAQENE